MGNTEYVSSAKANQGYTPEVLEKMANKHVNLNDIVDIPLELSEKSGPAKCVRKYKHFFEFENLKTHLTVSITLPDVINLEVIEKSGFKPKTENDIMNEIIDNFNSIK